MFSKKKIPVIVDSAVFGIVNKRQCSRFWKDSKLKHTHTHLSRFSVILLWTLNKNLTFPCYRLILTVLTRYADSNYVSKKQIFEFKYRVRCHLAAITYTSMASFFLLFYVVRSAMLQASVGHFELHWITWDGTGIVTLFGNFSLCDCLK